MEELMNEALAKTKRVLMYANDYVNYYLYDPNANKPDDYDMTPPLHYALEYAYDTINNIKNSYNEDNYIGYNLINVVDEQESGDHINTEMSLNRYRHYRQSANKVQNVISSIINSSLLIAHFVIVPKESDFNDSEDTILFFNNDEYANMIITKDEVSYYVIHISTASEDEVEIYRIDEIMMEADILVKMAIETMVDHYMDYQPERRIIEINNAKLLF